MSFPSGPDYHVTSIEILPATNTIYDDTYVDLTVRIHYSDHADVDMTYPLIVSSDPSVARFPDYHFSRRCFGVSEGDVTVSADVYDLYTEITWHDEASVSVVAHPPPEEIEGRFLLAFGSGALDPAPHWTRLDDTPNLVTSYTIDRGRQYELDRTDTGRATVQIIDPDGTLDPTNPDGPYYGQLQPLLQAAIGRQNPVTGEWSVRFRGFVDDFAYDIDPSQRVNRLTLSLVDLCDVLAAVLFQPQQFGTEPPAESVGQVFYPAESFHDRIVRLLNDVGLAGRFWVVFPGDPAAMLQSVVYSPGESVLSAIQEAADAEFPAVAQAYCDRFGRFVAHDKRSRFDPEGSSADVGAGSWDYQQWQAGDGAAVAAAPTVTAQLRELSFSRSLAKIINHASATPSGIADELVAGQLVVDATSIGQYGIRSWSADSLLTGNDDDGLALCRQFSTHYTSNYAQPRDRIATIGFRPLRPDDERAPALFEFLNGVDINDSLRVTVDSAPAGGGGGFHGEEYFVEGIHETVQPLTPDYDDVTLRLDLSPRAYYTTDPFD